jgi:hypothetical protein
MKLAKKFLVVTMAALLSASAFLACAPRTQLRPKVQSFPGQFPYSLNSRGVAIAVVPFDGFRDVFSDPRDPGPRRPDFDWLKAGVRPTRIILANDSQQAVLVDPVQVTCVDHSGAVYQAYTPREAGDAVVSSEAFRTHFKKGLKGAVAGAALGAGLGAALGSVGSYRGYAAAGAAAGAAWGGAFGGVQGLFVGLAGSRAELERRVRALMDSQALTPTVLSPGMSRDGLVFFPAVPFRAVRLVLAGPDRQGAWNAEIPVSLPPAPQTGAALPTPAPPQGEGLKD